MLTIPKTTVNDLTASSGDKPFPEGEWKAVIRETRTKDLPSRSDGTPFTGYATTDGGILTLLLADNEPLSGQDAVGGRVFFLDLATDDGSRNILNVTQDEKTESWQLQKSQRMLFNLAVALGQVTEVADEYALNEGFLEALAQGQFNGIELGYSVKHRKVKDRVYPEISTFFAL
jgi:hypothetical protein